MALVRIALTAALALCAVLVVILYPAEIFQVVAAAVIILSTASTLVFFGFVVRNLFVGVNERKRVTRMPLHRPQTPARPAPAPAAAPLAATDKLAETEKAPPLIPANPS